MHGLLFRSLLRLRQSYWFLPSVLTVGALVLGFLLPYVDLQLGADWMSGVPFLRPMGVEGARAVLTTLAGAVLGVAGVAFSITIVAVSFASGTYGPRLIGNFMSDRVNQVVLGIFVATFVYCVTVLVTVHGQYDQFAEELPLFVPQVSVLFAVALMLVNVGALIAYIHHAPESMNIMNIVASIGAELGRAVVAMLEQEAARDAAPDARIDVAAWPEDAGTDEAAVRTETAGYLQAIDIEDLTRLACAGELQIEIRRAPGDFLVAGEEIGVVRPADRVDGETLSAIQRCLTVGASRTEWQDLMFLADQLVEVLGRALSPGVNDPNTAILCLDWLRAGLVEFARAAGPPPVTTGRRVLYGRVTFEALLARTMGDMRQYVAADRNVTLHALAVLADVAAAAGEEGRAALVVAHMERLAISARESLAESAAREEVAAALANWTARIAAGRVADGAPGARNAMVGP